MILTPTNAARWAERSLRATMKESPPMRYEPSNVSSKYGAPMGRSSNCTPEPVKLYLQRVRLDAGGYDSGGAYWGTGVPLYVAFNDHEDNVQLFVRAMSRKEAIQRVLLSCPKATFKRGV